MRIGLGRVFVLVACAMAGSETRAGDLVIPDSRLGTRTAPLLLLSRPDVRADLGLSEAQSQAAAAALTDLRRKAGELRGKNGDAVVAARRVIDQQQSRWVDDNLTEPQQRRLFQIDLQWEGPAALVSRPGLASSLGLTDEQRSTLTSAAAAVNRKRVEGTLANGDEASFARQALSTLSESQRTVWKEMLGTPFVPRLAAKGQP